MLQVLKNSALKLVKWRDKNQDKTNKKQAKRKVTKQNKLKIKAALSLVTCVQPDKSLEIKMLPWELNSFVLQLPRLQTQPSCRS